ncbi:KR domain-containing protein [Thelonectria olida]|uniref:KR domain-containing protein n=1 Tax=Thelonectria olida TaxID=1576542 RepID=A0A9P8VNC6_9HYPO|nr:KR domain-containing protein [Thelonectria olida]
MAPSLESSTSSSATPSTVPELPQTGTPMTPESVSSWAIDPLDTNATPIAVCGMALRLPGGISTPSQFWDFLISKKDARGLIPESRFRASSYYSKSGKPGHVNTQHGYFLDESVNLGALDTTFFSMPKPEVERADPQQRLLLELAHECFESAGEVNYRGAHIGTYVGSFGEDWLEGFAKDPHVYGLYKITGYGDFIPPNRISYEYDLKGPSMTIRTGCSSALIGLHKACLAIRSGECNGALVGGCNLIMGPGLFVNMCEQGVLSPDGSSRSFDAGANGYARGEAINMVYIKKLSDAIRDGNPIRAVIRGTCSQADGKTTGLSVPNWESHENMIRQAYKVAGIDDFGQTGFVECHGTGTQMGDPIETKAVANVFGEHGGVYIGSVKPNMGHSEGASGITSLIKTVLALEHQTIPPNIKFENPNPKIPFKQGKLTVPVESVPWPEDRTERASVNSFGIGGANVHVILDSAKSFLGRSAEVSETPVHPPRLLMFSANTADSLRQQVVNHQKYLEEYPASAEDLSYTLALRRQHLPHRAFSIVGDGIEANTAAFTKISGSRPELVMIFTGQGAQWPRMGAELLGVDSAFTASIHHMDGVLRALPSPPDWSLIQELEKTPDSSNLSKAFIAQPLCTALQVALVDALAHYGVRPYGVAGHSSGEIAAAYAAGKLTADEAITAAYYRGLVAGEVSTPGAMAAIGMGRDETSPFLVSGVVIACENSPSSVTISGDRNVVEQVLDSIKKAKPGVLARILKVDKAYHSHHMKQVGIKYQSLVSEHLHGQQDATGTEPVFFSSVSGKQIAPSDVTGAQYWQANLESPVLFNAAVSNLVSHHQNESPKTTLFFLEVGPHAALAGPLRQILAKSSSKYAYASCLNRGTNSAQAFLASIGTLWQNNAAPIDLDRLTNPDRTAKVLTDLPTYAWHHDHDYMFDSRITREWRFRPFAKHELLGTRVSESTDSDPVWRNVLFLDHVPWVRDHNIKGDVIFPCAGYIGMVGEASRQMHLSGPGNPEYGGFAMRNVVVGSAMVLNENKGMEIVTSLKKVSLTESLESNWWEFVVSSHNGTSWTKHCTGQVCAKNSDVPRLQDAWSMDRASRLPRRVDSAKWYQAFRNVGANYGPLFQGLQDISCATTETTAEGTAISTMQDDEVVYAVHPTKVDFFLQLLGVADAKGVGHVVDKMVVPTNIDFLEARDVLHDINMRVKTSSTVRGSICGNGEGVDTDGRVVLQLKGVKLTPLEDPASLGKPDPHAGARSHWQPDVDFVTMSSLMDPLDDQTKNFELLNELNLLYIHDAVSRVQGIEPCTPYLQQFLDWMRKQPLPQAGSKISEIIDQLSKTSFNSYAIGMTKVSENIEAIFKGDTAPLEVLLPGDTLTNLYNFNLSKRTRFFQSLGHSKPNMRVLEIGAGTGGTTSLLLEGLVSPNGQPLYQSYTYTDISGGFFGGAKQRFKDYSNLKFQELDISKDPLTQGFEAGSFDLVLGANVLHATPSLTETLSNARKLLHPEGRLYMEELCCDIKAINFIMGILPGWWLGGPDGRADEPYVSPDTWDKHLREAGFAGLDDFSIDGTKNSRFMAFMTAKPAVKLSRASVTTVLHDKSSKDLAEKVALRLDQAGISASLHDLNDSVVPVDKDIISVIDLETSFFDSLNSSDYAAFQDLITRLAESPSGMLWLTRNSQVKCSDPRWGQVIGAFRVIRGELGVDLATCEIDKLDDVSLDCAIKVFTKFQARMSGDTMRPEYEYAAVDGQVNIPRVYPVVVNDELAGSHQNLSDVSYDLAIGKIGHLDSLHWAPNAKRELIGDEVELEAKAVGVNFRDVLASMGIVELVRGHVGVEAAGVVLRAGPDVKNVKPGDKVFIAATGCFSTGLVVSSELCVKMPDDLTFEEAATMPCVFSTVIYGLMDIGRLEEGQSVLIHSACGGVGLAAIQICKMVGAEIYCTVGNEEKIQYLEANHGIQRDHIFNSRDASFLPDLLKATNGRGVDIVLNSLSGELLHASWECVAPFGSMIEIGKRDLLGKGKLALNPFLVNRSYHGVDLGLLIEVKPKESNKLLRRISQYYGEGHIKPLPVAKLFPADSIEDCFRYMQKGQHIGKIVVTMDLGDKELPVQSPVTKAKFDADASYLLIGGLGGLGRAVSSWMVEHGARSLVYLSRNAGEKVEDQEFIEELRSQDCVVTPVKGSVTVLDDVKRAVATAPSPIKGAINMSMVLRDQNFAKMTHDEWTAAVSPKVQGTWNLHEACQAADAKLDFFLLFSSVSGIIGQQGQANYAGANTFLDSFVQYRHSLGLKASAIDIGALFDHGYVAENEMLRERLLSRGFYGITIKLLLDAITDVIFCSDAVPQASNATSFSESSQLSIGLRSLTPLSDPSNRSLWKDDRRMAVYHNSHGENASSTGGQKGASTALTEFIASAMSEPSVLDSPDAQKFVAQQIALQLMRLLLKPVEDEEIDVTRSLQDMGLDSLVAIEMKTWWKGTFGVDISVLEMLSMGNVLALGEKAVKGLKERFGDNAETGGDSKESFGTKEILVTKMP